MLKDQIDYCIPVMDAKDLRIGNIVNRLIESETRPEENYNQVSSVDLNDLHILTCKSNQVSRRKYSSIALTVAWLAKLGFTNEGYKEGYYGKTVKSESLTYDFVVKVEDFGIFYELKGNLIVTIDSVHQLQNLFYALTNKELII